MGSSGDVQAARDQSSGVVQADRLDELERGERRHLFEPSMEDGLAHPCDAREFLNTDGLIDVLVQVGERATQVAGRTEGSTNDPTGFAAKQREVDLPKS